MSSAWLSASEAIELVRAVTALSQAHRAICSRAHAGLVTARAKRLIIGAKVEDDGEIPAKFWWAEGEAALTQNWGTGDFETWIDRRIECRAYGVEFKRDDIEAMLPGRRDQEPLSESKGGNYAPAADCLTELCTSLRCEASEAQRLILRSCRAGLVPSRCSQIIWKVIDRYGEHETKQQTVDVPNWFWDHCVDDSDPVLNWAVGRFAARGVVDGDTYRTVVSGVQFEVSAIIGIETEARTARLGHSEVGDDEKVATATPSRAGRPASNQWKTWIAELVFEIHERGLPEGVGSQGQEQLIRRVADGLAERGIDGLARATVQPVVQAVLDRVRTAEN